MHLFFVFYVASLASPCIVVEHGSDFLVVNKQNAPDLVWRGAEVFIMGWIPIVAGMFAWTANLFAFSAVFFCLFRNRPGKGLVMAFTAVVISLQSLLIIPFPEWTLIGSKSIHFGMGWYLLEASLFCLVAYAYCYWRGVAARFGS